MSDVSAIRPLTEAIPGNKTWFVAYRKAGKQLLVRRPTLSEAMTALAMLPRDAEVEAGSIWEQTCLKTWKRS
jgi:hypothetical protein